MKFEVTILGSSSATPMFNRNPTSQLLNVNDKFYLIDCGEGTQQQMLKYGIKAQKIDHIFISHLHGDHYLGLVGLLSSLHLNGRVKPMVIYGPEPLKEIIELHFHYSQTVIRYPIEYVFTDPGRAETIYTNQDMHVETIPLDHRIACTGFKFVQVQRAPKLRPEKVEELGITREYIHLIRKGFPFKDQYGVEHPASELTIDPAVPRSYSYCSDTVCSGMYMDHIMDTDTLYHEATFMHDMADRAAETYHTTCLQAGETARNARVKRLLIGHFSARYRDLQPLLEEARSVFDNTELAIEGQTFQL
jgi:ribonuclease Z